MTIAFLPTLNALLNGTSAILLLIGYWCIRQKKIRLHKIFMLLAFSSSVVFLTSYLFYHYHAGSKHFTGAGAVRLVYFMVLISHTFLAVVIVPMVLVTLARALKGDFQRHRRIARWTFPLWMYVSVTGVVVYWMLYHLG
ncbi:MAG TPA: DUF420 domain-containing protein [Acidobacteriota bacterium]